MLVHKQHACDYTILLCMLFLFVQFPIKSQNLIPDPGFEMTKSTASCNRPDVSIDNLELWYGLNLNPDLFTTSCPFSEDDFIYWNEATTPPEGSNYVGLWSRWNSDNTYKTEGIAIELDEALEAGTAYNIQMKILNRGEFQGLIASCILKPDKHIDIYLSTDSIKIENDFANGTASTTATLASSIRSTPVIQESTEEWEIVSTCFVAEGGERFVGIVLPLGDFGDLPPCVGSMATSGVFRSFYYFIDDVSLTKLQQEFTKDTLVCQGEDIQINLSSIFDFDRFEEITYEWDDSSTESFRTLDEARNYQIDAVTNCGNIPLALNIIAESCSSEIYFPNIFDPTLTDINNTFMPMNIDQNAITDYQFSIYDRWGSRIFYSTNPSLGWNGESQNRDTPSGNYVWQISFETIELNERVKKLKSGSFTLVR